jgi:hypothetical protein
MDTYKHSICLAVCWTEQQLPSYFSFFSKTAAWNPTVDFIIFTEAAITVALPQNVTVNVLGKEGFSKLASEKLGLPLIVSGQDKINDCKPAFGKIFATYFTGYDFWGYCDLDTLFGNLREFLTDEVLAQTDFISAREEYPSSYFALFRNNDLMNGLFESSKDWKQALSDCAYVGFESCALRLEQMIKEHKSILQVSTAIEPMAAVIAKQAETIRVHKATIVHELSHRELLRVTESGIERIGKEGRFALVHYPSLSKHPHYRFPQPPDDWDTIYIDIFDLSPCKAEATFDVQERNDFVLDKPIFVNYDKVKFTEDGKVTIRFNTADFYEVSRFNIVTTQILLFLDERKGAKGHALVDFFVKSNFFAIQKSVPPSVQQIGAVLLNLLSGLMEFGQICIQ